MTNEVEFQTVNFAEEHQITIIYKIEGNVRTLPQ
jgi:hypothetical protein